MKYFLLSICFVLIANIAFAGDSIPARSSKHQLGLNVGSVTGLGLAYRYTESKLMHQVTFLPVVTSGFSFVDLSYSLFYKLKEREYTDFNLYCGTHALIVSQNSTTTVGSVTGGGFGFDFKLGSYFTANLNGGFALYSMPGSTYDASSSRSFMILPAGELGLFYKL